ncbi:MAG: hypothetical protein JRE70_20745 [Deltaproteobacteria bacterium]|nr:hypothetical protein [Deltaproteobacteria bacterium]
MSSSSGAWVLGAAGTIALIVGVATTGGEASGAVQLASMLGVALLAAGLATGFAELRTRRAGSVAAEQELGRAIDDLRVLAESSRSLPAAAQTLEQTRVELADLRSTWAKAQAEGARDVVGVLRDALLELRSDMKLVVEASGAATRQAVAPLVADGIERTARAATERLDVLLDGFSRELEARRESERALADALRARIDEATGALREVAGSVQAGGIELSAVAQMFGESVDKHCQGAAVWGESLGQVEEAVERAGQEVAAEAMRSQLAATEELFGRQLQFQRALFEQVRMLRWSGSWSAVSRSRTHSGRPSSVGNGPDCSVPSGGRVVCVRRPGRRGASGVPTTTWPWPTSQLSSALRGSRTRRPCRRARSMARCWPRGCWAPRSRSRPPIGVTWSAN